MSQLAACLRLNVVRADREAGGSNCGYGVVGRPGCVGGGVAAVGLIVPGLAGRALVLTPLAAVGLAGVMVGAAVAHTKLREPRNVAVNAVLFVICVGVAAGRFAGL